IMTAERYRKIAARRTHRVVILDIAVPRDFDPRIHDGDETLLFNIDDLKAQRLRTLARRREHIAATEVIVEQETQRFLKDMTRRRNSPVIESVTKDMEAKRQVIVSNVRTRLNGKLAPADQQFLAKAFSLFQTQTLHGRISALGEETPGPERARHTLLEAIRK